MRPSVLGYVEHQIDLISPSEIPVFYAVIAHSTAAHGRGVIVKDVHASVRPDTEFDPTVRLLVLAEVHWRHRVHATAGGTNHGDRLFTLLRLHVRADNRSAFTCEKHCGSTTLPTSRPRDKYDLAREASTHASLP